MLASSSNEISIFLSGSLSHQYEDLGLNTNAPSREFLLILLKPLKEMYLTLLKIETREVLF